MTDNNYPSAPRDGQNAEPQPDFGQPGFNQGSAPQNDNPYSAPAADQNLYGGATAGDQNPYGAPAGDFGAPAGDFGAPAGAGQPAYGDPAGQQYGAPYGGDQGQYGAGQYGAPGQPQYGAPGQPQYGAAPGMQQISPQEEVESAKNGHMFSAVGAIFGFGWLVSLIFYLTQKDKGAFVRQETAAAFNFHLSFAIYYYGIWIISLILMFIFIGFLTMFVAIAAWAVSFIFGFINANRVGNGGTSSYPLTIKFVK